MKPNYYVRTTALFLALVATSLSCIKELDAPPPNDEITVASNLRKAAPVNLSKQELLGKFIYFDKRLSSSGTQSCATCHSPKTGFGGEIQGFTNIAGIYEGAVDGRYGNRKPPSAAYASFSPVFHFSAEEGLFEGGNFWDGRATGLTLGSPTAEKALGPFLNPLEQNCPNSFFVLDKIASGDYAGLWKKVYGVVLDPGNNSVINDNYNKVGYAIAAYEASKEVNQFSSKYDYYLKGKVELNPQEYKGLTLFNGKAKCDLCHTSTSGDHENPIIPPLFTDFTYDNLGVPRNPDNPYYYSAFNPLGSAWVDKGLGGFLEKSPNPEWRAMAAENIGKHKVPTLRNVGLRVGAAQRFMHNGAFRSLKEVVDFYNTRDVKKWPAPEVAENVNDTELGNLGLSPDEVNAVVAFMKTLSDGYR